MRGEEAQVNNYKNKIDGLLAKNLYEPYYEGFVNYMECAWTTRYNYLQYAVNFVDFLQARGRIDIFSNEVFEKVTIDDYLNFLSTINGTQQYKIIVYSGIKKFSEYLYATGRTKEHYMKDVNRPKFYESVETVQKREIGYLEKEEIKQLLDAVKYGVGSSMSYNYRTKWRKRDLALILLMLTTGLRESAIYKLDIDSVDLEEGTLTVLEKGNKIREVSLVPDVIEALNDWLKARNILLYFENTDEPALFISRKLTRLTQKTIIQIVKKYSSVIKGKNITPHKLRATYGTQLYNATKDIYMVQQNMGHSSPAVTEKYIRGQQKEADQKAKEIMSNLIKF